MKRQPVGVPLGVRAPSACDHPAAYVDACAAPESRIPSPESRLRFCLLTFGCRVNQAESFEIEEALRRRGAVESRLSNADLIVVNTCTVTGRSDQGARQAIRRLARTNPGARIVVTGCYATRRPDDLARLPNVVELVPNAEKASLGRVFDALCGPARVERHCGHPLEPGTLGRTAIPLRVQTGCSEACTFCIIPATRGPSRSRPLDEVCRESARLAAAGYREIWLVGVHLGAYGRDLTEPVSLVELVAALAAQPGEETFRLSSLEPMDCSDALVDLVAASRRLAPHVHLPLQHGSDSVLRAMRRPYDAASFETLVGRIAERIPHAAIGTDVLVGFPGETDDDVEATVRLLERLPLAYLHVFPYSDRPGTLAAGMVPKVGGEASRARAARLRGVGDRLAARFAARQLGTVRAGLTLQDGTLVVTDNYLKVRIPPGLPRNTPVHVRIEQATPDVRGRIVSSGGGPSR